MDNLFDIKLNINQIAELVGMHRQTVSQRVAALTPAKGSNSKLKLYSLADLVRQGLSEKMSADVDQMSPTDQLAFFNARLKELEFKKRIGELCETSDAMLQQSHIAKGILLNIENLPDKAEREGFDLRVVTWLQKEIDNSRDQAAEYLIHLDDKESNDDSLRQSE